MNSTISMVLSLFLISCSIISFPIIAADPIQDLACKLINCGQGSCKASNETLLGFDCDCNPGWKKIQLGPLTFPSCQIPNCTLYLGCTGEAPSPQPFQLPPLTPPINLIGPCSQVWCGDGVCSTNGTSYICNCSAGAFNYQNSTTFPCFKPCTLGSDCFPGYLPQAPTPIPGPLSSAQNYSSPTPQGSTPNDNNKGSRQDKNSGTMMNIQNFLTLILPLAVLIFTWI